jgi:glycosyltransferase involved in cell wall biosynthesis
VRELRTALVHDYLLVRRGAERTFEAMAECWPDAPIYTLLYDAAGTDGRFEHRPVRTSSLQRLRVRQSGFRNLLPLLPRAAESLPVQDFDLVVSSSSAFAHGVQARDDAVHVCYCHSPFRYAWHELPRALDETPWLLRPAMRRFVTRMRRWDRAAAGRVTHYVANSEITRERIAVLWGRDSTVVYPPVEVERFSLGEPEDYFLVVTELVRHKRVELALEAARRAGVPLKVVGTGPERERLKARFGESASFLGRISDRELADVYSRARAVLLPNVEEFGIAAVEAQAAGRPVVAADAGGARETVIDGETGVLVPVDDLDAFTEAISQTDFDRFSTDAIRRNAERFSREAFEERLTSEVNRLLVRGDAGLVEVRGP